MAQNKNKSFTYVDTVMSIGFHKIDYVIFDQLSNSKHAKNSLHHAVTNLIN
jgi:hypothetical protein